VDSTVLAAMTDVLEHRGPDDRGVATWGNIGLGNRRLAIIDIDGGHQPMETPDGKLAITYNGELYNYVELRTELQRRGFELRTHSDTEVILQLYACFGLQMFERMNGMFAFALYDRAKGRVLFGRDRFGEKPLYIHRGAYGLSFASEIKALFRNPEVDARPDHTALHEYLTFQYCLGDRTMFEGVTKLRPASFLLVDERGETLQTGEYWSLAFEEDHDSSDDYFVSELRALVDDAVRIRLRSDVAVGTYLSGGLDSSIVAATASSHLGAGVPAFTGYFDLGHDYDETRYARAVAARGEMSHHVVAASASQFAEVLPRIIWYMDEPAAGPGVFPQYVVSALAQEHVKVVLGGQGGDELFGGYARYLMMYLEESLMGSIFGSQDPERHVVTLQRVLPHLAVLQQYVPLLKRFWSKGLFGPVEERYFSLVARSAHLDECLAAEFVGARNPQRLYESFESEFNDVMKHSPGRGSALVNRMTAYDARTMLQSLLHVEDRMSMAVSLESRLPLLDHRIAELAYRMPPALKYHEGEAKSVLKRACGDLLPPEVLGRRDKMGFPVPFVEWARGELREFVGDILLGERARARGLYRLEGVEQLIEAEQPYGRELWGLLCLELWFRVHIDGDLSGTAAPSRASARAA
jgi:asparagine synthase (glutamine-hydrolysing)